MAGGLQKYTVVESNNLGLGQVGSAYLSDTTAYSPQSGKVIIAIQIIDDCSFAVGTTAESTDFTDFTDPEDGTNADAFSTDTFPAGVTIYGRWTAVQLTTAGAVMLYMGS